MALIITKKVRMILIVILVVLVTGSGGFLVWRVNQPDTVAPEDSMAAPPVGQEGGTLISFPCSGTLIDLPHAAHVEGTKYYGELWGQWVCGEGCGSINCPPTRTFTINGDYLEGIYNITGVVGRGHDGQSQTKEDFIVSINNLPNDQPLPVTGSSNNYAEEIEQIGKYHIKEGQNSATMSHLHTCPPENAPMSVHLYKLCLVQENICNQATTILPDSVNEYGTLSDPVITIQTSDPDGIGKVRNAKVNGQDISSYEISGSDIRISVSPNSDNIPAGEYNVDVAWEDGLGIGGSNCTLSTSFEVSAEQVAPSCGTLEGNYTYSTTEWPEGTFCGVGQSEPTSPAFPSLGGETSWVCSNDGMTANCLATRDDVNDPACGTLEGNYTYSTTEWPEGTFCGVGVADPISPVFPSLGGETSWVCTNDGVTANCLATRDDVNDPSCGTLEGNYTYSTTEWPEGTFCAVGESDPASPTFPTQGGETAWVCTNDGVTANCLATRDDINDPSCGTLEGNYSSGTTDWPEGTFCAVGESDPTSPVFPTQGGQTNWICNNEGNSTSCIATRDGVSGGTTVPQTGVFDSVLARISLGVSFMFLGGLVSQYSRINYFFNSISEKNQFKRDIRKERRDMKRKEKEEKRAKKRRARLEDRFE